MVREPFPKGGLAFSGRAARCLGNRTERGVDRFVVWEQLRELLVDEAHARPVDHAEPVAIRRDRLKSISRSSASSSAGRFFFFILEPILSQCLSRADDADRGVIEPEALSQCLSRWKPGATLEARGQSFDLRFPYGPLFFPRMRIDASLCEGSHGQNRCKASEPRSRSSSGYRETERRGSRTARRRHSRRFALCRPRSRTGPKIYLLNEEENHP